MSSPENRRSSSPKRGRSDADNGSVIGGVDPTQPSIKSEDGFDAAVSTAVQADQGLDETLPTLSSNRDKNVAEREFIPDVPSATAGDSPVGTLTSAPKWTIEPERQKTKLSPVRDLEAPMVAGVCSGNRNGGGGVWSTTTRACKSDESSAVSAAAASPSAAPPLMQRALPAPLPSQSPLLLLPPPPPQQTPNLAGMADSGGGGGVGGTTALRDLDGCLVWYTDDSAAEADIESMASVASVDSREDDLEAAASTDSEVASTASSTGGASSVASGDSSRGRTADRDLSLSPCSTWNGEGEEDVLLGLSLARARMTAGKAACSCAETSCFCRFKSRAFPSTSSSSTPSSQRPTASAQQQLPGRAPLARSELDPRDLALVAAINRMATGGDRARRNLDGRNSAVVAVSKAASAISEAGMAGVQGTGSVVGVAVAEAGGEAAAAEAVRWKVHPDCAIEFAERFIRRDIALAGRVQAVRLLKGSTRSIFSVVVRCGGFRALYGWLGDVWERVRAHKLPRAGPPDWGGVGGRVFVEELLCVLARVPISVDMLRETEIARVAKKFRRLAERHGLESMTAASNRLRAHLHAVVSRGVQEGLFFRNRTVGRSVAAAVDADGGPRDNNHHSDPLSHHSIPYSDRRPDPWNSKGSALSWGADVEGAFVGYYGGTRGCRSSGLSGNDIGVPFADNRGESFGGKAVDAGRGSGSASSHHLHPPPRHPLSLSILKTESPVPALRSARLRGWRRRQDDGSGEVTGSLPAREDEREWDDARGGVDSVSSPYNQQSASRRQGGEKGRSASGGVAKGKHEVKEEGGNGGGGRGDMAGGGDAVVGGGYAQRSTRRRRVSKTEPWVLDLSYRPSEKDSRARWSKHGSQRHGYSPAKEGGKQRRTREGVGEFDDKWINLQQDQQGNRGGGGGGRRVFRPLREWVTSSSGKRTSSMNLRRDGVENPSEDGSWEESFDWWPRPRSPLPSGVGNAYYPAGGDFPGCSGVGGSSSSGGGKLGQQGSALHLPTVPTFEESGTRVSWADYRGHSLAEVHEIEPGYSREDFALPGRVGLVAETCRRDMSKKEEQLLSPEDHERLAAAARESDSERVYGGGAGGGGDSEGTISDSENSTTGDPDAEFQQNRGGSAVWRDNGAGEEESLLGEGGAGSSSTPMPKILNYLASSVEFQDGGGDDDLIDRVSGGAREEGNLSGSDPRGHARAGSGVEMDGSPTRHPRENSPQNSPRDSLRDIPRDIPKNSHRNSSQNCPRNLKRGDGDKDDGGSESGCSSLHSPQRVFSPTEDETSPPGSPSPAIPPRRFTSPNGQRSPPGSPTVSSPGSSRSGSVADGNEVEAGSTKRREVVSCPPVARNAWEQLQRSRPCAPRDPSCGPPPHWEEIPVEGRFPGRRLNGRMPCVIAADGSNRVDGSARGEADPQSNRHLVDDSDGADEEARRGGVGGPGISGDPSAGVRVSLPWGARESRWPRGGRCEVGRGGGEVGKRVCKGKSRAGSLAPEDEDARARGGVTAAALLGVQRKNVRNEGNRSNSGGSGIESQRTERGESRSCSGKRQRAPTSSPLRHAGGGDDGSAAGRRRRDRHERARTGRSLVGSRDGGSGGGSESGTGTGSTRSTSIIRKIPLAGVAASADSDVGAEGAASTPWHVRWATGAPFQRGEQCDRSGASGADSSPDSGRRRPSARRRIDGGAGVIEEETKSNNKSERLGERRG